MHLNGKIVSKDNNSYNGVCRTTSNPPCIVITGQKFSSYPNGNYKGTGGNSYKSSSTINTTQNISMQSKNIYNNIIEKTKNPQHGNILSEERIINLSNALLKDEEIGVLVQHLKYQALELDIFNFSNNNLGYASVENLFYTFRLGSPTAYYNIKCINLSNNVIGDDGAKYIASHLESGLHPNLKALDLSENKITDLGHRYLANALNSAKVQSIIIRLKLFSYSKQHNIDTLQHFLKLAEKSGINVENIVTHKSMLTYIKDIFIISGKAAYGFIKCKFIPEDSTSFAKDQIVAKLGKYVGKIIDIKETVQCYIEATDDVWITDSGVKIINRS